MWQIFAQNIVGTQPLHVAAMGGHEDVVSYLRSKGATVDKHRERQEL